MKVEFPIVKKLDSNRITYPDDIKYFANCEVKDGKVIADYSGKKVLSKYIEPIKLSEKDKAKQIISTVNTEELDKTDIGKAVKALLINAGLI